MPQPDELLCVVNDTLPPTTYDTNLNTQLTYAINFPYVNQNDVVVFSRTGNVDTLLHNQAFDATGTYTINQGVNPSLVTFTTAPGGDELIIARMTDICNMLVVYEAGASIRAEDLNAANTQLLNLIQENYQAIVALKEQIGTLLTTPLYQTNPVQNESSWTNERIPSGAAALAQLNTDTSTADPGVGNFYDGKLWWQPSTTTQAQTVTLEVVPGSSTGLAPAWPGANDLDGNPNTVATYDFDQNISGGGSNLRISVSIVDSNVSVVSIINGGEGWADNDTAETGPINVENPAGTNSGTIRLRATVTGTAPGLSYLRVRRNGQWDTITASDSSANPFIPVQTLYVNTQGNDANSGRTPGTAFRTIKKAVYECNKFVGTAQTLTFETTGANVPVYNNTDAAVNGVPPGFIRYTCTTATGLNNGDIVTIPPSVWNCAAGNETYPAAATQFAVTVVAAEPNNLYIDVGPTPTVHTFANSATDEIAVRQARVGDNFQIQVAPGSYDEMMPIVIYAKNLCITGSSLRNTYVHPRVVAGTQPDGTAYTPASLGNVTDDKGGTIEVFDTEVRTMFYCDSGTYINNMTVCGIKSFFTRDANGNVQRGDADPAPGAAIDPSPTYGLPKRQGWIAELRPSDATLGALVDGSVPAGYVNDRPGCFISKSPYIQNCTNFSDVNIDNGPAFNPQFLTGEGGDTASAPTGGGILCDGTAPSLGSPLRSFVVDAFTQIALNGPGILCTNKGYSQLVSFFGTFCWYHAKALNGGQLNLSNCTTDFGQYGLIADQGTMTGGGATNPHIFTGEIANNVVAATPPANTNVLNVTQALWNNTAAVQNTIPAGQLRLTVDYPAGVAPAVGQSIRLANVSFRQWDATAPTDPDQGDPDPTGQGAYVGLPIQVPGFAEGNIFVIDTVNNTAGDTWEISVPYKQEVVNLGGTNTFDPGAYTNTTTGGQTVFAGFVQDQNTGVATIQAPVAGAGAGIPSTFIRVTGLTPDSNLWQTPRKPEPGTTQLVEIQHTEGSVFYPILAANRINATTFDVEIYSPYSSFDRRNLGLVYDANAAMGCRFYLQSYISTGGHTFEFVGSGTDYDAHPDLGGEGNPANQAVELNGVIATAGTPAKQAQINTIAPFNRGRIWLSSTDEVGTFQVGDTFKVNQKTGLISIDPSVIVAPAVDINEDLDMKQWAIVTEFGTDTNLLLQPNGNGGLVINATDNARPSAGPSNRPIIGPLRERDFTTQQDWDVVTQQDLGYDPDEVPVNVLLGELAYVNTAPSVALNNGDPEPNEMTFSLNEGTNVLTISVRKSDNTIVSTTLNLS